ncbi:MAG: hypothetical protein HQL65_14195 [Magnetococcales bacterium]|nr:hypothetical protein [Magnetococcales bacterium]MBF0155136.1 hypothetical protein [Magnetococcales bacterium]
MDEIISDFSLPHQEPLRRLLLMMMMMMMMLGWKKSDSLIVAVKPANKTGKNRIPDPIVQETAGLLRLMHDTIRSVIVCLATNT